MDDLELMNAVSVGEHAAFRRLVTEYWQRIRGFAYQQLQDDAAAGDVAQETFGRLWQARERFRPTGSVSAFIYTVARNLCRNERRRRARHPEVPLEPGGGAASRWAVALFEVVVVIGAGWLILAERGALVPVGKAALVALPPAAYLGALGFVVACASRSRAAGWATLAGYWALEFWTNGAHTGFMTLFGRLRSVTAWGMGWEANKLLLVVVALVLAGLGVWLVGRQQ